MIDFGQMVEILSRLSLGALSAFLAILLWSNTRDTAWMFIVMGTILWFGKVMYNTLEIFGIVRGDIYIIAGISLVKVVFFNLPYIFFIIAFIIMISRSRVRHETIAAKLKREREHEKQIEEKKLTRKEKKASKKEEKEAAKKAAEAESRAAPVEKESGTSGEETGTPAPEELEEVEELSGEDELEEVEELSGEDEGELEEVASAEETPVEGELEEVEPAEEAGPEPEFGEGELEELSDDTGLEEADVDGTEAEEKSDKSG